MFAIVRSQAMKLNENSIITEFMESLSNTTSVVNDLKSGAKNEVLYTAKDYALDIYNEIANYKITEERGVFDLMGIWDEINTYAQEKFLFANDCYLLIQQTSAFCAIDVNTGNNFSSKNEEINLEACKIIVNNIRVRGIGGKIVIDFLPTSKRNRIKIRESLVNMFSSDSISTQVFGWTSGNNFEIERKRSKTPLCWPSE